MNQLSEQLHRLLSDVNDWLRFAESKNAVIIGLNGAAIFGFLSTFPGVFLRSGLASQLAIWSIVMLSLSTVVSLLSFLPRLEFRDAHKPCRKGSPVNLLYFGSIAALEPDDLIFDLSAIDDLRTKAPSKLDWQYAQQIVNNSRIAVTKYRLFTLAVWLDLFGIAPPIAVIAFLVTTIGRRRSR